jgi:hypothetical protein
LGASDPVRTLAGGRTWPVGGGGALEGGRAEPPVPGGRTEPEAEGPSVSRIWPVGGRPAGRGESGGTAPVAGCGSGPERGSSVTRGTPVVAAFGIPLAGKSVRCGCGGVTSSGMAAKKVRRA